MRLPNAGDAQQSVMTLAAWTRLRGGCISEEVVTLLGETATCITIVGHPEIAAAVRRLLDAAHGIHMRESEEPLQ